MDNDKLKYTRVAIVLHWAIAALVLIQLALGLHMEHFPGYKHTAPEWAAVLFYHGSIGALIFGLTLVRLFWLRTHPAPAWPSNMPSWQTTLAHWTHKSFYVLLLLAPLIGYAHRMPDAHSDCDRFDSICTFHFW
jgi:cytochrome b561